MVDMPAALAGALAVVIPAVMVVSMVWVESEWAPFPLRAPPIYKVALDCMLLDPSGWAGDASALEHKAAQLNVCAGSYFNTPNINGVPISTRQYNKLLSMWRAERALKARAKLNEHLLKEHF